jgi:hypothetical protein
VPGSGPLAKESVCGRYRREVVEGCGCGRERAHRRDEAVVGSGRGRSLREETVRLGGRTGHGCHSGPLAEYRAVYCVVVRTR